jgi:hypothetical protein
MTSKRLGEIIVVTFVLVLLAMPVLAEEVGRYQASPMGTGQWVCILDTKEGHCWFYAAYSESVEMIYMGKVRPGKYMGEMITGEKIVVPVKEIIVEGKTR